MDTIEIRDPISCPLAIKKPVKGFDSDISRPIRIECLCEYDVIIHSNQSETSIRSLAQSQEEPAGQEEPASTINTIEEVNILKYDP